MAEDCEKDVANWLREQKRAKFIILGELTLITVLSLSLVYLLTRAPTPKTAKQDTTSATVRYPEKEDPIDRDPVLQDKELIRFQQANQIPDEIAEAAIKEWLISNLASYQGSKLPNYRYYPGYPASTPTIDLSGYARGGYTLAEVKELCLRNRREGIPRRYLPEPEKPNTSIASTPPTSSDEYRFTPLSDHELSQRIEKVMSDPEKAQMLVEMQRQTMSTPEGRDFVANNDALLEELDRFQRQHGLSNREIEAACKESDIKTGRGYWVLEDVKRYALRNHRDGIPFEYLPEREKDLLRRGL